MYKPTLEDLPSLVFQSTMHTSLLVIQECKGQFHSFFRLNPCQGVIIIIIV